MEKVMIDVDTKLAEIRVIQELDRLGEAANRAFLRYREVHHQRIAADWKRGGGCQCSSSQCEHQCECTRLRAAERDARAAWVEAIQKTHVALSTPCESLPGGV